MALPREYEDNPWCSGSTQKTRLSRTGLAVFPIAKIAARSAAKASSLARSGRLSVLELSGDRIHSMNPDRSDRKTIVTDCHLPDGIVVDAEAGHIYWTNMGVPNLDDGSIERADLDGGSRKVIVPQGVTHPPKQIHLDRSNGKLYWCDRECMRVAARLEQTRMAGVKLMAD